MPSGTVSLPVVDSGGHQTVKAVPLVVTASGIVVPAPSGGNDRAMIQAVIDGAPDGSTIRFEPNATYLVGSSGVGPGRNKMQNGITLLGQNAELFNESPTTSDFRHMLVFGGIGTTTFKAIGCAADGFRTRALVGGGSNWGHGVIIRNGSHDILLTHHFSRGGNGDGFYVGDPGGATGERGGPYNVTVEDSQFGDPAYAGNHKRHACTVTNAHDVTFTRCYFEKLGSSDTGGTLCDIEPLNSGDVAHHVTFDDCTFGWYSPNTSRRSVQANGSGTAPAGAYVHTVTVKRSRSIGNLIGLLVNSAGGSHPLFHDFAFEDNESDPAFAVTLPMVKATSPVDVISAKRNRAPISTGSFVSASGCTNVVAPTSGPDANVDTT